MKISNLSFPHSYKYILLLGIFTGSLLLSSIAKSDIVVVVHPQNPVDEFSLRQVSKLFMGRMPLFPVSGKSVILLDQKENQSSYQEFYNDVIRIRLDKLKRYRAAYLFSGRGNLPLELSSDEKVKEYVARHTDAVGYIDATLIDDSVKAIYRFP